MLHTTSLSYLMQPSWKIQRKNKHNRSKSLQAAWAITVNEDITIYYLVKRHSNKNAPNKEEAKHLTLFSSH